MKEYQATVYESFDGMRFTKKDDCMRHEDALLKNVEYFAVSHTPDLNETGNFTKVTYLAIMREGFDYPEEIAKNYALVVIGGGKYLCGGVMGRGCLPFFKVRKCDREAYITCNGVGWGVNPSKGEQVFIAEKEIPGFPKPFNYRKEWGFN